MRTFSVAVLAAALAPVPLAAQTSGVFDMGTLTATVSQDAVTQSEERRAGMRRGADDDASAAAQARANCARRGEFRRRHGANDPRVREFYRLCARAGY